MVSQARDSSLLPAPGGASSMGRLLQFASSGPGAAAAPALAPDRQGGAWPATPSLPACSWGPRCSCFCLLVSTRKAESRASGVVRPPGPGPPLGGKGPARCGGAVTQARSPGSQPALHSITCQRLGDLRKPCVWNDVLPGRCWWPRSGLLCPLPGHRCSLSVLSSDGWSLHSYRLLISVSHLGLAPCL